jgi:sirohydrochlorin ferrochelatase
MLHEDIVEPAHMELAEPSIATAYRRCVEQGATRIICYPYFLSKGRHVVVDIPAMLESAALPFPTVSYTLTNPLGLEPEILDIMKTSVRKAIIDSSSFK